MAKYIEDQIVLSNRKSYITDSVVYATLEKTLGTLFHQETRDPCRINAISHLRNSPCQDALPNGESLGGFPTSSP